MALFRLFSSKKVANSDVNPVEINEEQEVNNENEIPVEDPKEDESKKNLITITWGTGMPIDVIFHYIHKNYEEEGYQDAIVDQDVSYRDARIQIIRYDLEMLFKRIKLRYSDEIRTIKMKIDNYRKAYAFTAVSQLEASLATYEEHLEEIENMEHLLADDDPKMTSMIESYKRGFMKGINAVTMDFIDSNH